MATETGGTHPTRMHSCLLGYDLYGNLFNTCRLYLLQGELFCCTNNPTEACQPFLSALTLAKQHNLLLMIAMATVHLAYVQVNYCLRNYSKKIENQVFFMASLT